MASNSKIFSFEEVAKHNHKKDCWIIVHEKVYDVTPFLYEHPGGDEVLLSVTGKDATLDFEDVGAHDDSAKELMQKYFVGEVDPSTLPAKIFHIPPPPTLPPAASGSLTKILLFLFALLILGLAFSVQYYVKKKHATDSLNRNLS